MRQKSPNVDTMSSGFRLLSSFSHPSVERFYSLVKHSSSSALGLRASLSMRVVFLIALNIYAFSRGVVIGHVFLMATLGAMGVLARPRRQSLFVECIAGLRLAFPIYALELLSIIVLSNYFYPAALFGLSPILLGCVVLDFVFLTNKNLMRRLVPDVQAGASVLLLWQTIVSRGYDWMKSLVHTGSKPEVSTGKTSVPNRAKNGRSLNDPLSVGKQNSDKHNLDSGQPMSPQGGSVSPDLSDKILGGDVESVAGQAYKSPLNSPLRQIESQLLNELQLWQQASQDPTVSSEQPKIDEIISYIERELMDGIHQSFTDVGVEGNLHEQLADCGADEVSFIGHVARRFLAQAQLSSAQKQPLIGPIRLFATADDNFENHVEDAGRPELQLGGQGGEPVKEGARSESDSDSDFDSDSDSDEEQEMPGTAEVLQTVKNTVSDVIGSAVTSVVGVVGAGASLLSPSKPSGRVGEDFQVISTEESGVQGHDLFSTPASSIHSPARSSRAGSLDGDTENSHEFADAIIGHVDSGASESCDDQGFTRDVPSTVRPTSGMKTGSSDDENGLFCDASSTVHSTSGMKTGSSDDEDGLFRDAPDTVLSTSGVKTGGSDDHDPVVFDDIDYELGQKSGGIGNPGPGQLN